MASGVSAFPGLSAALGGGGRRIHQPSARKAAVLVLLVGENDPGILLFERTHEVLDHKGEICFPGGSFEPQDRDATAAALREAHEELGLSAEEVSVVGLLDDVRTGVSNFIITPVVGFLHTLPLLAPSPLEVSRLLIEPLRGLRSTEIAKAMLPGSGYYPQTAYEYAAQGCRIWGATASIIRSLLTALAPVREALK